MILRTGSNLVNQLARWPVRQFNRQTGKPANRQTKKGFTLIEVMVATAVLSLGALMIYEAFLISLDAYNYCSNYLRVASWMDERLWQAQNELGHFGPAAQIERSGEFVNRNKNFSWSLTYALIGGLPGLHKIDLGLSWKEGRRDARLLRSTYATYAEKR